MKIRAAVLWITGRDLLQKNVVNYPNGAIFFATNLEIRWEMTFTPDGYFKIKLPSGPNVLHRAAQRVVLGIRWRMLPKNEGG